MKVKCLVIFSWCLCCVQSFPGRFYQSVQFLPPATSFTTRADEFHSNVKISNHINFNDVTSVFHHTFSNTFEDHITPDFSDGLSYPDPFLRTGGAAKRIAAYLYSKELFFGEIPHIRFFEGTFTLVSILAMLFLDHHYPLSAILKRRSNSKLRNFVSNEPTSYFFQLPRSSSLSFWCRYSD